MVIDAIQAKKSMQEENEWKPKNSKESTKRIQSPATIFVENDKVSDNSKAEE